MSRYISKLTLISINVCVYSYKKREASSIYYEYIKMKVSLNYLLKIFVVTRNVVF